MDPIDLIRSGELAWFQDRGFGYCDPRHAPVPYDDRYFEEYQRRDSSETSDPLCKARFDLVQAHYDPARASEEDALQLPPLLIDVGIGAGAFIRHWLARNQGGIVGYDIMPAAVCWLAHRDLYRELYAEGPFWAATFWDSLEHIADPAAALARVSRWAFISMPIYESAAHCRSSKHFKPGEHLWYFTQRGLVDFMGRQGFALREHSQCEIACGREDIGAFAFERVGPAR